MTHNFGTSHRTALTLTPYEALADAVIWQAADDYIVAYKLWFHEPNNYNAKATVDSLERFFRSGLYQLFTSVSPEYLIRKLREEVRNGTK